MDKEILNIENKKVVLSELSTWEFQVDEVDLTDRHLMFNKTFLPSINDESDKIEFYVFDTFILTKDEIEQVANNDRNLLMGNFKDGEYNGPDVLKYGSDPNKPFYYMCPRYWCLLTNKPLTEQQVANGECGGKNAIIPKNVKKVPKGKSIYEFYDDKHKRYPGFHKEQTPNGQCIPCCYDNWNKPAQISRRAKCSGEANEFEEKNVELDTYIKGPDKFPLGDKRWGYLPFPIQIFFNELSVDCQISKTNTNIKPFHNCLLRLGVENSDNQSFIGCIANALFYGEKNEEKTLWYKTIKTVR
jgi:hypothetical protein